MSEEIKQEQQEVQPTIVKLEDTVEVGIMQRIHGFLSELNVPGKTAKQYGEVLDLLALTINSRMLKLGIIDEFGNTIQKAEDKPAEE